MKKILVLAIILLVILSLVCIAPAHAAEVEAPTEPSVEETPADDATVSQVATDWLAEHFGDITGAVCTVGLAILAWLFKKALIPAVNAALQRVSAKSEESHGAFLKETEAVRGALEQGRDKLEECSARLDKAVEDWQKKTAAQSKAYELQTDLINYLLLNLRIPNELKVDVAERSAAVKAALDEANKAG